MWICGSCPLSHGIQTVVIAIREHLHHGTSCHWPLAVGLRPCRKYLHADPSRIYLTCSRLWWSPKVRCDVAQAVSCRLLQAFKSLPQRAFPRSRSALEEAVAVHSSAWHCGCPGAQLLRPQCPGQIIAPHAEWHWLSFAACCKAEDWSQVFPHRSFPQLSHKV